VSALFADQSEFLEKPPFSTRSSETRSRKLRYPVVLVLVPIAPVTYWDRGFAEHFAMASSAASLGNAVERTASRSSVIVSETDDLALIQLVLEVNMKSL
jgi:hypothetical protein